MFHMKIVIFVLLILCFLGIETFGGGQNRAGTSGAPELRIPVGARYIAMVGSPIALVTGLESIYWNPAGLDRSLSNTNALFSYRSYIADMSMNFAAISGRFGDLGSIGLSFRSLNIGEINVTSMDQPDGTGQIINPSYFILGITYSKQLTDRISIGASFNLINESIDRAEASGLSFDFGVQYFDLFEVPGFALGVVVKNLGAQMKYEGSGTYTLAESVGDDRGSTYLQFQAASAELPSELSIGLSYEKNIDEENSLTLSTTFQSNNYTYDDYKVGLEYTFKDLFYARGGYLFSPQATDVTPNIFQNYALGVGLNFEQFSDINLSVDYAFVPVKYFDSNHIIAISFGF